MKRITLVIAAFAMVLCMVGCGGASLGNDSSKEASQKAVTIKASPDKYTYYMKNYVGLNLASCGSNGYGNHLSDSYGGGDIDLCVITDDGSYIDLCDDEAIKGYQVVAQSLAPNTEIKYTFGLDEDGNEYDYSTNWQNIYKMDLLVKKINTEVSDNAPELMEITPSTGRTNSFVQNYVGRNLGLIDGIGIRDEILAQYGPIDIHLIVAADDGTAIETSDVETTKQYIVTGQDIEPNTEITYEHALDSDGKEYDFMTSSQSIDRITLYVTKLQQ